MHSLKERFKNAYIPIRISIKLHVVSNVKKLVYTHEATCTIQETNKTSPFFVIFCYTL